MSYLLNISLTELQYVVAVSEELHFGKAATKCFVSQPTLSIAIKKLEETLQITLFERSKNKVIITEIGKTIILRAKNILQTVADIQNIAKNSSNPLSSLIKIGAIHTIGPYIFPDLMDKLSRSNSQLNLIIEEGYTNHLYEKLINGTLDAIIIAEPFNSPFINKQTLFHEPLDVIIPKDHVLNSNKKIKPELLDNETLLLLDKGNCFRDQVLQICPQCITNMPNSDVNNKNFIVTTSLETVKYMVGRNLGISIVPRSSLSHSHKNTGFNIKQFTQPVPKRTIVLAYRKNYPQLLAINELVKFINKIKLF